MHIFNVVCPNIPTYRRQFHAHVVFFTLLFCFFEVLDTIGNSNPGNIPRFEHIENSTDHRRTQAELPARTSEDRAARGSGRKERVRSPGSLEEGATTSQGPCEKEHHVRSGRLYPDITRTFLSVTLFRNIMILPD